MIPIVKHYIGSISQCNKIKSTIKGIHIKKGRKKEGSKETKLPVFVDDKRV